MKKEELNRRTQEMKWYMCLLVEMHNQIRNHIPGYAEDEIDEFNVEFLQKKLRTIKNEIQEIDARIRNMYLDNGVPRQAKEKHKLIKFSLEKGIEKEIYADTFKELLYKLVENEEEIEKLEFSHARINAEFEYESGHLGDYNEVEGKDEEEIDSIACDVLSAFNDIDYLSILEYKQDVILFTVDEELGDYVVHDRNLHHVRSGAFDDYYQLFDLSYDRYIQGYYQKERFSWKKIKFIGYNTSRTLEYIEYADSYKELADKLLKKDIIHYDELDEYIYKKYDVTEDYFMVDDEWNDDKYLSFMKKVVLSESEYREFIEGCNGNAYYQYYYKYNDELQQYVEDYEL